MMRQSFSLALACACPAAIILMGAAPVARLWLDTPAPLVWNQPAASIAAAPTWTGDGKTIAGRRDPELLPGGRCSAQIRAASRASERAVAAKGWFVFAPAGSRMIATSGPRWSVIMGTADADGMCRPVAYQVFVFVDGSYAGTISPALMTSRSDGAFIALRTVGNGALQADFVRYADADPLCCPHAITHVRYAIRTVRGRPIVVPTSAVTAKSS